MKSPAADLTDSEWATLDESLALPPLSVDTSWLDGYLAGMALQPKLPEWSACAPETLGHTRLNPAIQDLIDRRLIALRQALSDKSWWDPYLRAPQTELPDSHPEIISDVLMPWVAGLEQALEAFPLTAVNDHDELAAMLVQARVYRHLPALDEQEREVADLLNQTFPLESLEDAVDELTACLAELWDLSRGATPPQSD